jgi:polyhydroxyalkanoate synthesis regulator phasin
MALSGKLVTVEDQLTVGTVTYTQSLADDNERLRHKVATLENDIQDREEVYRIGMACQEKMQELEEKCIEKINSVVDSLTEEHKQEVLV